MIYLLDTNAVSDLISQNVRVRAQYQEKRSEGHAIALCPPVLYEIQRGFLWRGSARKQIILHTQLVPLITWIPLIDSDWEQAAQFWADTVSKGLQISDVDLLIAALAYRLEATVVTSDEDFEPLPISHENWR